MFNSPELFLSPTFLKEYSKKNCQKRQFEKTHKKKRCPEYEDTYFKTKKAKDIKNNCDLTDIKKLSTENSHFKMIYEKCKNSIINSKGVSYCKNFIILILKNP